MTKKEKPPAKPQKPVKPPSKGSNRGKDKKSLLKEYM